MQNQEASQCEENSKHTERALAKHLLHITIRELRRAAISSLAFDTGAPISLCSFHVILTPNTAQGLGPHTVQKGSLFDCQWTSFFSCFFLSLSLFFVQSKGSNLTFISCHFVWCCYGDTQQAWVGDKSPAESGVIVRLWSSRAEGFQEHCRQAMALRSFKGLIVWY